MLGFATLAAASSARSSGTRMGAFDHVTKIKIFPSKHICQHVNGYLFLYNAVIHYPIIIIQIGKLSVTICDLKISIKLYKLFKKMI